MPPGPAHYRGQNSNPFNNYSSTQFAHPPTHFQHQNNFPSHGLGNGPYPGAHQNGNVNAFGSGLANGGLGNTFSGGLGGVGPSSLGSHEVQMRFAQGAAVQQQQQDMTTNVMTRSGVMQTRIREVWKGNLKEELDMIRSLVDQYPYVSMDTEFPGVVARPMGNFPSKADYHYQCLRCNVDLLKIIQLGITLFSVEGDLPPSAPENSMARNTYANNLIACPCTWTFNFKFSLEDDMYSEDSISMLKRSGVDFARTKEFGIDPKEFGSRLIDSGLVLFDNVTWLSFHSGYDFGYLVKLMSQQQLPEHQDDYLRLVRKFFPRIYDIKYLFRHAQRLAVRGLLSSNASGIISNVGTRSGLQDIADELGCQREGKPHTAGSDAWLTGLVFWQMRQKLFEGNISEEHEGMIWGLTGVGPPAGAGASGSHQTPSTNGASLYTGMTPSSYQPEVPSTPQTSHTGLNTTPGPHGGYPGGGMAGLTSGGVFSSFGQHSPHQSHSSSDLLKGEGFGKQNEEFSSPYDTGIDEFGRDIYLRYRTPPPERQLNLNSSSQGPSTPLDPTADPFRPAAVKGADEQHDNSQPTNQISSSAESERRSRSPHDSDRPRNLVIQRVRPKPVRRAEADAEVVAKADVDVDANANIDANPDEEAKNDEATASERPHAYMSNLDGALDDGDISVALLSPETDATRTTQDEHTGREPSTAEEDHSRSQRTDTSIATPSNLQGGRTISGPNTARQGRRTRREKRRRKEQLALMMNNESHLEAADALNTAEQAIEDVEHQTIPETGTVRINHEARRSWMSWLFDYTWS